jgi:hypothetical protein
VPCLLLWVCLYIHSINLSTSLNLPVPSRLRISRLAGSSTLTPSPSPPSSSPRVSVREGGGEGEEGLCLAWGLVAAHRAEKKDGRRPEDEGEGGGEGDVVLLDTLQASSAARRPAYG